MDADTISWFEQAMTVTCVGDTSYRALFRCKFCAALIEGSYRAAHRYWHLGLAGAK